MSGKFGELTRFIPAIKEFGDGDWVFKNRRMPYIHYSETMHEFFHACAVFGENNPDLEEIKNYREIIKNAGIERKT